VCESRHRGIILLATIIRLLELCRRHVADRFEKAPVVEPVSPVKRCKLYRFDRSPRTAAQGFVRDARAAWAKNADALRKISVAPFSSRFLRPEPFNADRLPAPHAPRLAPNTDFVYPYPILSSYGACGKVGAVQIEPVSHLRAGEVQYGDRSFAAVTEPFPARPARPERPSLETEDCTPLTPPINTQSRRRFAERWFIRFWSPSAITEDNIPVAGPSIRAWMSCGLIPGCR